MVLKYQGGHWSSEQSPEEIQKLLFDEVSDLAPDERMVLEQVLEEMKELGFSPTLEDAYDLEYEVPPVDAETFLNDDYFFGAIGRDMRPKLK